MTHESREQGAALGRPRVARLMRDKGYNTRRPHRFRRMTDSGHAFPIASTPLLKDFTVAGPGRRWGSDISYIWTRQGWLYRSGVRDLSSRPIVGLATGNQPHRELALTVLWRKLVDRPPGLDLIRHSSTMTIRIVRNGYWEKLRRNGTLMSLSGRGNYYDSAVVERPSSRQPITLMVITIPAAASRPLASPAPLGS